MSETIREAEDWRPPQWVAIQPNKVYFKALDMPPEDCKRWLLDTMRGCMTGEREAGSDADRLLKNCEENFAKKSHAGRTAARARWGGDGSERNANALPPQSDRNAHAMRTQSDRKADAMRNDATVQYSTVQNSTVQDSMLGERSPRAPGRAPAREKDPKTPPKPKPQTPAEEAKALGFGLYAEVAASVRAMLPGGITPAKLYAAAALKQLPPTELEKFAAHYSGRGWEFPTKREDKPRPITDANVGSAIASWALNQPNYEGGTNGKRNADRGRDRPTGPTTQAQLYVDDPFS